MLANLVASGASARQIGATMRKTRNAIIGRCKRTGIKLKCKPSGNPRKANRASILAKVKRAPVKTRSPLIELLPASKAPAIDPVIPVAPRMVALVDLKPGDCRWPVGSPQEPDFGFCGHARDGSASYCAHHRSIAYLPPVERRRATA